MYHYSYVFPKQVKNKIEYYKAKVSRDKCIDGYFKKVYLPWVNSSEMQRYQIEKQYLGVHEFKQQFRGECFTAPFVGEHPEAIQKNLLSLTRRFNEELENENSMV